jgi:hypothetical protein
MILPTMHTKTTDCNRESVSLKKRIDKEATTRLFVATIGETMLTGPILSAWA